MHPPLLGVLRVTLQKRSQERDFTQVRVTRMQAQGGLTVSKVVGQQTVAGIQLSGIIGDILAHISFAWLLDFDRH